MRQTQTEEVFLEAYDCRVNIINGIADMKSVGEKCSALNNIKSDIDKIIELLGNNYVKEFYLIFKSLFTAYEFLTQWEEAVKNAAENSGRFHEAYKYHIKEAFKKINGLEPNKDLVNAASGMDNIVVTDDIGKALKSLSAIPLPLPIHWEEDPELKKHYLQETKNAKREPMITAFLNFKINNENLQDPHLIDPNTLYDLNLEVRINRWPGNSEKLVIQPLSDVTGENYQMPTFEISKNEKNKTYHVSGRMAIKIGQTFESQPLEFVYQAYILPGQEVIAVTGNNRINVRSNSEGKLIISGYYEADKVLMTVRSKITKEAGITSEQRINFLLVMKHLANIAGQALASNDFPDVWAEKDFQTEIRKRLRAVPEIGSQLLEHPNVAAGIPDLFFKKLQIELKTQNEKIVTLDNAQSFSQQGAQYVAGSDNRLGIICILDCSDKKLAPGSLMNDIGLISVPVPGIIQGGFPLILGVVIIRGNLGKPSSFSK